MLAHDHGNEAQKRGNGWSDGLQPTSTGNYIIREALGPKNFTAPSITLPHPMSENVIAFAHIVCLCLADRARASEERKTVILAPDYCWLIHNLSTNNSQSCGVTLSALAYENKKQRHWQIKSYASLHTRRKNGAFCNLISGWNWYVLSNYNSIDSNPV